MLLDDVQRNLLLAAVSLCIYCEQLLVQRTDKHHPSFTLCILVHNPNAYRFCFYLFKKVISLWEKELFLHRTWHFNCGFARQSCCFQFVSVSHIDIKNKRVHRIRCGRKLSRWLWCDQWQEDIPCCISCWVENVSVLLTTQMKGLFQRVKVCGKW